MSERPWYSVIPRLFPVYSEVFETQDGYVIAYQAPSKHGGGYYGKLPDGSFIWEPKIEDLYCKHDVELYDSFHAAASELC